MLWQKLRLPKSHSQQIGKRQQPFSVKGSLALRFFFKTCSIRIRTYAAWAPPQWRSCSAAIT
jgi:hypothetical protein